MNFKSSFARFRSCLPAALLVAFAGSVHAHPGHAGHDVGGIGWGLAHPFTGMDHLLAMVAVGLWAVQLGGRALWVLPLSFIASMALGGILAMTGVILPSIEPMILGSALVLGAMVALASKISVRWSAVLVAMSAFFHGQAHGIEMPAGANGAATVMAFVAATAVLHGVGILGGVALQRTATQRALRAAGVVITILVALVGLDVF